MICSNYPRVTFVNIMQISTTVRLYSYVIHRQHSTNNPVIKQSLLLQFPYFIEQSKVADSWIGVSTDTG